MRAPNRFHDPQSQYRLRYLATTPRGAFLEVRRLAGTVAGEGWGFEVVLDLAHFRLSPEADDRLQAVA